MLRKVVLGTLLVGLIGVLVAGAVIRTTAKTGNVAEARGLGQGQGFRAAAATGGDAVPEPLSVSYGVQGSGRGANGQAAGAAERQYPNYTGEIEEWVNLEGVVAQAQADGEDLIVTTAEGEEIVIGAGPSYMEQAGFALEAGETVRTTGYWEDGEFKAAQVTRLSDGQTITLRDTLGRPAWAGAGRNAQGTPRDTAEAYGNAQAPGDGTGTGQAVVDAWLTLQGTVTSVDANVLSVQTSAGEIVVENRAWWYARDQGFTAEPGDQVTLVGFYENDDFETGQIVNETSGETVFVREDSGRPMWAGGAGRRAG